MTSQPWYDDEQLLLSVKDALHEAGAVPPEFIEAGKAAYAWHTIDAELAALTYDSATLETVAAPGTRAEAAALRALTFASAEVTIELEVTPDAIMGQILPPQSGSISAHVAAGQVAEAAVDELGFFVIRPIPKGTFRLCCRTASGIDVLTGWISP